MDEAHIPCAPGFAATAAFWTGAACWGMFTAAALVRAVRAADAAGTASPATPGPSLQRALTCSGGGGAASHYAPKVRGQQQMHLSLTLCEASCANRPWHRQKAAALQHQACYRRAGTMLSLEAACFLQCQNTRLNRLFHVFCAAGAANMQRCFRSTGAGDVCAAKVAGRGSGISRGSGIRPCRHHCHQCGIWRRIPRRPHRVPRFDAPQPAVAVRQRQAFPWPLQSRGDRLRQPTGGGSCLLDKQRGQPL